jgi:endo-1,4-beta-mannosidase
MLHADAIPPLAGRPFLLGVNYWPRSSAMAMWSRFDAGEIDEDFARIAALGLHAVRFFMTWETFAPEPRSIDARALSLLGAVLDGAERRRLLAMPTFFTGHMSGVNWLPGWALDPAMPAGRFRTISSGRESPYGAGDLYAGPLLEAQRFAARAIGAHCRDRAVIHAWDLGNEFSNLRVPASPAVAAQWSAALSDDLHETSNRPVTGGIHGEDLTIDRNIRPSSICAPWDVATMHGYPVYSEFARDKQDPEVVPFLAALTGSFSRKPVLFSEFGNPSCSPDLRSETSIACLDDDEMALYARAVLERLHARGALGAFWWCWTDYAPELAQTPPFDRAPHELRFGIVRADGSEKPVARALAAFASERREVLEVLDAAGIDEDAYYRDLPDSTKSAYASYRACHAEVAR